MAKHRIIISGTRSFGNYERLKLEMFYVTRDLNHDEIEIVSGGAHGADRLGEQYAKENGFPIKMFKADWKEHGKYAGPLRNKQMANYGTHLVCFWDGESRGAHSMITEAKLKGLWFTVVLFTPDAKKQTQL